MIAHAVPGWSGRRGLLNVLVAREFRVMNLVSATALLGALALWAAADASRGDAPRSFSLIRAFGGFESVSSALVVIGALLVAMERADRDRQQQWLLPIVAWRREQAWYPVMLAGAVVAFSVAVQVAGLAVHALATRAAPAHATSQLASMLARSWACASYGILLMVLLRSRALAFVTALAWMVVPLAAMFAHNARSEGPVPFLLRAAFRTSPADVILAGPRAVLDPLIDALVLAAMLLLLVPRRVASSP